ncbi:acetyl-CoA synthetase-like protein [Armillaria solidipes]|uniref:Acetyl-CoA synthetase-like protein n=1 Tax=Armillaria solidipes TaxID=1076256 RepID=A0A2H3BH67_9AGAR|nr:acetyl-CoA synthetase-like protein [Armillaria solidipes]
MTQAETWIPSCSVEEAHEILTRSGSPLEIEVDVFNGRQLKVWKNQPPSMREFYLQVTEEYKNKTYVVYGEERYSFQGLFHSSIKCAVAFKNVYGIKKGDRVTICSRNRPAYLAAFWACHLLGAVSVLLDPLLPLEPLKHCLTLAKCTILILDPDRADMVHPIASELKKTTGISVYIVFNDQATGVRWAGMDAWTTVCSEDREASEDILNNDPNVLPDDDAAIFFTSETTGLPKAVLTSHRACLTAPFNDSLLEGRERLRQGEPVQLGSSQNSNVQGGILLPRVMCHIGPFASMMTCTYRGLKLVITRTWDPPEVVKHPFSRYTTLLTICSVAIVIRELADNGLAGYPLESVVFTGGTIPSSFFQSVRKGFPQTRVQQVYGITETTGAVGGFGKDGYGIQDWYAPVMIITGICRYLLLPYIAA